MRIKWDSVACEPEEIFQANARHACSLSLPYVAPAKRGSLAVCGGGPSLSGNLDRLRDFDEIWGVNRTAAWLCGKGISATFFTVDPQYVPGMTTVDKAILASSVHPRIFEELAGKDVALFHIAQADEGFVSEGGPSSVCRAIPLAVHMGYSSVTFFGCEGSYEQQSHSYPVPGRAHQIIIRAAGRDYTTQPDFQLQCEYLAEFLKASPEYFKEESGGLLRAMIEDDDWQIVALSGAMMLAAGVDIAALPQWEG